MNRKPGDSVSTPLGWGIILGKKTGFDDNWRWAVKISFSQNATCLGEIFYFWDNEVFDSEILR
jgi:hypothetical protein